MLPFKTNFISLYMTSTFHCCHHYICTELPKKAFVIMLFVYFLEIVTKFWKCNEGNNVMCHIRVYYSFQRISNCYQCELCGKISGTKITSTDVKSLWNFVLKYCAMVIPTTHESANVFCHLFFLGQIIFSHFYKTLLISTFLIIFFFGRLCERVVTYLIKLLWKKSLWILMDSYISPCPSSKYIYFLSARPFWLCGFWTFASLL